MDYDDIHVEDEVLVVAEAVASGEYRHADKRESMEVRLAALSSIIQELQATIKNDKLSATGHMYGN
ncbi:MAG: hypothetical protein LBK61_00970 [Spirochaetaceae bacterium]|jgi:hypothetical protein|nr:hypothetical protein [Spirochaetaceae bacterium]